MNVSARVKASREAPSATTAMGPSSVGPAGEREVCTVWGAWQLGQLEAVCLSFPESLWEQINYSSDYCCSPQDQFVGLVCVLYRKLFSAFFSLGRLPFILK